MAPPSDGAPTRFVWENGAVLSEINCPHCGRLFAVPANIQGRRVACPNCKGEFVVPAPSERAVTAPSTPPTRNAPLASGHSHSAARPSGAEQKTTPEDVSTVACPHCARRFAAPPHLLGRRVACPGCRGEFVVPPQPGQAASAPSTPQRSNMSQAAGPPAATVGQVGVERGPPAPDVPTINCPHCGHLLTAQPNLHGRRVACASCGGQFVIPEGPKRGTREPPPVGNSLPAAGSTFPALAQPSAANRPTMRVPRSFFRSDPIDLRFAKYLTPWIVRIIWVGALTLSGVWAALSTGLLVKNLVQSPPAVEHSSGGGLYGEPRDRAEEQDLTVAQWVGSKFAGFEEWGRSKDPYVAGYFAGLAFNALFLLCVRMMLECVIVFFRISSTLDSIEKAVDRDRDNASTA